MFYRIRENKLYDFADYKYADDCLETSIITQAELNAHPNKVIVSDGLLALNPDYEAEETAKRETEFKSKFFEIPTVNDSNQVALFEGGWYRKIPKGYSSAIESLSTAYNIVKSLGKLPADTLIFYTEPDYSKPEQCTEEWLVAHQFKNSELTEAEFMQFYLAFVQAWNNQEH